MTRARDPMRSYRFPVPTQQSDYARQVDRWKWDQIGKFPKQPFVYERPLPETDPVPSAESR